MIPLLIAVASNPEPTPRAPFAIAEIHVRDTPEQTRAALTQAGYKVVSVKQSASMRQKLLNARANQLHQPVPTSRFLAVDSIKAVFGDQEITVRFDDDASGARVVARVSYVASDLAHPYPRVGRALLDRYGTPTKQRPQSAVWCIIRDDSCDAGGIPQTDMLEIRAASDGAGRNVTTINLTVGEQTRTSWMAAHQAELRRLSKVRDAF